MTQTQGNSVNNHLYVKPLQKYQKTFLSSTPKVMECHCPVPSKQISRVPCIHCKQPYAPCCLRVLKMCVGCRSKLYDPVNIVQQTMSQVFFLISDTHKVAHTYIFTFLMERALMQGYGIEIRCFKPDKGMIQFPMLGTVFINDTEVTKFKPLIKCSNVKVRKDISFFLDKRYLKPNNQLKIVIEQCKAGYFERYQHDQEGQPYFLGIYLIKCQNFNELMENLSLNSFVTTEESIAKFFQSDGELENLEVTIKLQCPYSSQLIKVPARGSHCQHFQTFCLETLYKLYSEKRKWDCPICGNHMQQIMIDRWVFHAIRNKKVSSSDYSVKFFADGKYEWLEGDSSEESSSSEEELSKKVVPKLNEKRGGKEVRQDVRQVQKEKVGQKSRVEEKPIVYPKGMVSRKTVIPSSQMITEEPPRDKNKEKNKQKEREKEKGRQKEKEKEKDRGRHSEPIVIEDEENTIRTKREPLVKPHPNFKSSVPQLQFERIPVDGSDYSESEGAYPMIDFDDMSRDRAHKFLKTICNEKTGKGTEEQLEKPKVKELCDDFKRLFKLY